MNFNNLLKYLPEDQAELIQKQDERKRMFRRDLIALGEGEAFRIVEDPSGKYPPFKVDNTNFITCLTCEEMGLESDFYVSLKSYRHHYTKIHGEYFDPNQCQL